MPRLGRTMWLQSFKATVTNDWSHEDDGAHEKEASTHTVYQLKVEPASKMAGSEPYSILRRYSNFLELEAHLSVPELPSLPPTNWFPGDSTFLG